MFAPELSFASLNLTKPENVALAYERRVEGYYLKPASILCESGHAFAAGVVAVSAVDFLASFHYSAAEMEDRVSIGKCFKEFVRQHLSSFSDETNAKRFYNDVRNGLVHEARLKNAAEFNLAFDCTLRIRERRLVINPRSLIGEVRSALAGQVASVRGEPLVFQHLVRRIEGQFAKELAQVDRGRRAA